MKKQFIVVTYDISDDKRRTKLHKSLKNYGFAVQESVFECLLSSEKIKKMKMEVKRLIKKQDDAVRFYKLCNLCYGQIHVYGKPVSRDENAIIV